MSRTAAQSQATKENFALWVLWGFDRLLHHTKPVLSAGTYRGLKASIRFAIKEVKDTQAARIERKRK